MAHKISLIPELSSSVHDVFHVSMLKKYVFDPSYILNQEPIEVHEDLTYEEKLIKTLDREEKLLRNKVIRLVGIIINLSTKIQTSKPKLSREQYGSTL